MKPTSSNDRYRSRDSHHFLSTTFRSTRETSSDPSLAVDGHEDTSDWSKCTTIDNFFVNKPRWMVDLGRMKNIAGVMLRTLPNIDLSKNVQSIEYLSN
jgi:hypothetical protein